MTGFGGGKGHQSSVPSQIMAILADLAELRDTEAHSTKNGQHSRADAGSIGRSALSASAAFMGSISAQQIEASCHSQRA